MNTLESLMNYINQSPNCYLAVQSAKQILKKANFIELDLTDTWQLQPGLNYFVIKNDASIIAFKIGKNITNPFFKIVASHNDSPSFKLKPQEMIVSVDYSKFNTEPYGGILLSTWMDRPLGLAGRVFTSKKHIINLEDTNFIIPSLAIHLDREAGLKPVFNPQIDSLPLVSLEKTNLQEILNKELNNETIISHDLFLYNKEKAILAGTNNEFICAPRLDDLECAYVSLEALIEATDEENINICAIFNNEEVGSSSNNGANSTFLVDVINEITTTFKLNKRVTLAKSLLISADNAHAIHPNHPEKADPTNYVKMNQGIVIKYHAGLSYTTDAYSAKVFKNICQKADIKTQDYTNRSDLRGGGTLGSILLNKLSINSIDIGLAQLAMHSSFETAGAKDVDYLKKGLLAVYNTTNI